MDEQTLWLQKVRQQQVWRKQMALREQSTRPRP